MIKEAIVKLAEKEDLSGSMAEQAMDEIMSGQATPVQMSAFLVALSMKGATIEEITACARGMRNHCVKLLNDLDVLEIVGTGGDRANSLTFPPYRRWWSLRQAYRWQSTATGRPPANAARQTCWRLWG